MEDQEKHLEKVKKMNGKNTLMKKFIRFLKKIFPTLSIK